MVCTVFFSLTSGMYGVFSLTGGMYGVFILTGGMYDAFSLTVECTVFLV